MKTSSSRTESQQLVGMVQIARLRLAEAESKLKSARQQARLARRRRKEAKAAARRAKKQTRLAKQEFAEAEQVLAEAEAKLLRSRKSSAKIKNKQAAARKASVTRKKEARPAASSSRKSAKLGRHKPTPAKRVSNAKARLRKAAAPVAVPRDFETPTATGSPDGENLVQAENTTGETHPSEAAPGNAVEPDRQTH